MSKIKKLMKVCKRNNLNCSVTYQSTTDYSVEIYKMGTQSYDNKFVTDGHIKMKKAIKKALNFMETYYGDR